MMPPDTRHYSDAGVLEAWHENAEPWTETVRSKAIESRRLVTDHAIVDAALRLAPRSALDLGCGEGWLTRALAECDIRAYGVDAVPALVEAARQADPGAPADRYACLSYQAIARGALDARYDLVLCNFSLLGFEVVAELLAAIPGLLAPGGSVLIQTLHPPLAGGDAPYRDGWRDGDWTGCGKSAGAAAFGEPAPWYFRTIGSWISLIRSSGLELRELSEPLHPQTKQPASLILVAAAPEPR
ncbi:class I SAM-dependent methyltransferase [Lysobacter sp. TAB13]|uniref:class I SAM-dependent methyltransferase n=1 Tax=Lysobacter sp. TAB13 TaxID=3233065 RepID=UPI003F9E3032